MDVFLNGRFLPESQAVVPISDRGLLYGDGLFETLRVFRARPFRWKAHMERFQAGAKFLRIQLPWPFDELQRFASQLLGRNGLTDGILRITLTRGSGTRGYSISGANTPTLAMTAHPLTEHPGSLCLKSASLRVPINDWLAQWKTSNKLLQIIARTEALDAGVDEALLWNTEGRVAEASASNVFWVEDGMVCTPPITEGALAGITRSVVLELCRRRGIPEEERLLDSKAVARAQGIFLTNSGMGIVPVSELDGRKIPSSARVGELQVAYAELLDTESLCD